MKKVYIVRHGQSEGNISNVYQPFESPLTPEGKKQAEYIAERVLRLPIDSIIASPQDRAKETAQIIAEKLNKTIEFSDLFVERIKPSELSGRSHDDPAARKLAAEWNTALFASGVKTGNGENFNEIKTRALKALDFLAKLPEEHILVITHGFFMRTIAVCVLFGEDFDGEIFRKFVLNTRTKNTGLSIFEYDESAEGLPWKLLVWNDHAHLADPKLNRSA